MTVTICHNPNCGTSRNVLAMIRQSGEEPVIVEYLKSPPTRERLKELIAAMGIPVRALLREKRHALCGARAQRPEVDRRSTPRLHASAPDLDKPADCHHTQGGQALSSVRDGARHSAEPKHRASLSKKTGRWSHRDAGISELPLDSDDYEHLGRAF